MVSRMMQGLRSLIFFALLGFYGAFALAQGGKSVLASEESKGGGLVAVLPHGRPGTPCAVDGQCNDGVACTTDNCAGATNATDTVGGMVFDFSGQELLRGNIYECSSNAVLQDVQMYLSLSAAAEVMAVVYEADAATGPFTLIDQAAATLPNSGVSWYTIPGLETHLTAGKYYAIAFTWDVPTVGYYRSSLPDASVYFGTTAGYVADEYLPDDPGDYHSGYIYYQRVVGTLVDGQCENTADAGYCNDGVECTDDVCTDDSNVVGNSGYEFSGTTRARGNLYLADTAEHLLGVRAYLGMTSNSQVTAVVYSADVIGGPYTLLDSHTTTLTAGGTKWYSVFGLDVTFTPGTYYAIGLTWNTPDLLYSFGDYCLTSVPVSFGDAVGNFSPNLYLPSPLNSSLAPNDCHYFQEAVTEELTTGCAHELNDVCDDSVGCTEDTCDDVVEDTLGGTAIAESGSPRMRGNVFEATSNAVLESISMQLDFSMHLAINDSHAVTAVVYEAAAITGPYTLIDSQTAVLAGPGIEDYTVDGLVTPLTDGKFYAIGFTWDGPSLTWYAENTGSQTVSFGVSNAHVEWTGYLPDDPSGGIVQDSLRYQMSLVTAGDGCSNTPDDNLCDDGLWCNGAETCDTVNDCETGADACADNGLYCDGTESCNETDDICEASGDPCDTGTEECNETDDQCDPLSDDDATDDDATDDDATDDDASDDDATDDDASDDDATDDDTTTDDDDVSGGSGGDDDDGGGCGCG
ncbi:MAG: hypothetical protein IT350_10590 [Deltaproteobacteria bacterium]|nr:hypothetical protein [Deltaproteobacteria bacterium]